MKEFIKVYDNVVKPNHCKAIIDAYENNLKCVEAHDTDGYKFHQLNLNQTPGLEGLSQAVVGSLIPVYEDYFNRLGFRDYVKIDTFEDIRIKKYRKDADDEFRTHVDVIDHASAARFAIAIIYLNDNDGYTVFENLDLAVEPKAGRVVVFPPFWMFPHSGRIPTVSDKYIMMTCLHYS